MLEILKKYQLKPLFRENLKVALQSIKSNKARSLITIAIIAFGIMALVGILTSIDAIKATFNREFALMGANTFSIESRSTKVQIGNRHNRVRNEDYISYKQAKRFKEEYTFSSIVAISTQATGSATVKFGSNKSNPNIQVIGCDENYMSSSGFEIGTGRNFSLQDIETNRNFVVIGSQMIPILFKNKENPIDKVITIGDGKYKIIGVLKEKGSGFGEGDRLCWIPYTNARQYFARPNMNFSVTIMPSDPTIMEAGMSDAEGLFRQIRNLRVSDPSDFEITRSDNLIKMVLENIGFLTVAATFIGIITLFGAAIGLMNIMLVSVTERTSEIGTRKALGAKSNTIKQQFLFEAIVIGQIGGLFGIFLGILIGNVVSLALDSAFLVPWQWIIFGSLVCLVVGVISGYMPALKAARLDPIEALRHE